jgi:catechol 2,3-dioxygenase
MTLIKNNFTLPFNITRCSYTELGVKDLTASRKFYVDTLGFVLTEQTADALYLRGLEERNHHSIILRLSETSTVLGMGFRVSSHPDLDQLHDHFKKLKLPVEWVLKYAQGRTLKAKTPEGILLEFHADMKQVPCLLQKYGEYRGAHIQRFDHFNCFTTNAQATYEFLTQELGFRLTEYTMTEDGEMWAAWMHRKGNVHDFALTNGDGPRLHHIGFWVCTPLNIIHLCDVMATTGYVANIERGPGRHGISNAFFLYVRDPDGHRIEIYTNDYLTVDPDLEPIEWNLNDPQRQTLWGHPAPQSWFTEGSRFEGLPVKKSYLKARPIVAP